MVDSRHVNGIKQSLATSVVVLATLLAGWGASVPRVDAHTLLVASGEERGQDVESRRATALASSAVPARPRFHVQAGAFVSRENAVSLQTRLRDRGYAVTIVDDGELYHVWVGGYLDRNTAERLASILREHGLEQALTPR